MITEHESLKVHGTHQIIHVNHGTFSGSSEPFIHSACHWSLVPPSHSLLPATPCLLAPAGQVSLSLRTSVLIFSSGQILTQQVYFFNFFLSKSAFVTFWSNHTDVSPKVLHCHLLSCDHLPNFCDLAMSIQQLAVVATASPNIMFRSPYASPNPDTGIDSGGHPHCPRSGAYSHCWKHPSSEPSHRLPQVYQADLDRSWPSIWCDSCKPRSAIMVLFHPSQTWMRLQTLNPELSFLCVFHFSASTLAYPAVRDARQKR